MKKMVPLGRLSFVVVASLVIASGTQAKPSSQTHAHADDQTCGTPH